jgi:alpha-amylase/alpha-mannosidase (GH57 family)
VDRYICIHGHFYQPPRENAWLEVIEVQDSAHPYHDWNERISAECYAPNTASRILDAKGIIRNIINNYSRISFNFGPTLLSWMEENDPETYEAILRADAESAARFSGHGSALAQVYNHAIMPLCNARDKETQVYWGIKDFVHRFKRHPEGMWLAETAVDLETLDLLAKYGVKFTILAPRQAMAVRKIGAKSWQPVDETLLDTRRPYVCRLPSGKTITIFFYHGGLSQSVAFNGLLNDGDLFARSLMEGFDARTDRQLVNIATDGETYGHHHKHGDMALAYCLDQIDNSSKARLTNYAEYLAMTEVVDEVQIHENSSWSCVHGVERWRDNCGCNTGGHPDWHQLWRKPLREALDWLRDQLIRIYSFEGSLILKDPWQARNEYISVILDRRDEVVDRFLKEHRSVDTQVNHILRLLEMQRHSMLMFTSCGWFFDEVSGIETTQILQYACRAIQLANQISDTNLEAEFIERLADAPSNIPMIGNAAQAYMRFALPAKTNLQRVGMHYAVASLFEEDPENFPVFNHTTTNEFFVRKEAGEQRLVLGITGVKSNVTRTEKRFAFCVVCMGKHNIIGNISQEMQVDKFHSMQVRIVRAFQEGRLGDVIGLMQTYFGPHKYTLWHLFKDEKRKVLDMITRKSLEELEYSLRRIYNHDYPLVTALDNNDVPIPNAYRQTFQYVLNADLLNWFRSDKINIKELERIIGELDKWKLTIEDPDNVARLAGDRIYNELRLIASEEVENQKRIERLNRVFPLLRKFDLKPNLYKSQNLYFLISRKDLMRDGHSEAWLKQFQHLGENLRVKVEIPEAQQSA